MSGVVGLDYSNFKNNRFSSNVYGAIISFISIALIVLIFSIKIGSGLPTSINTAATSCEIRLMIIIDRSSSISVSNYGGSAANVTYIKKAINDSDGLINAVSGPHSSVQVVAFADRAYRFTSGWMPDSNHTQATAIRNIVSGIGFKSNISTSAYGGDPILEGRTNWHAAYDLADRIAARPTHVIMFTDGNPTTYNGDSRSNTITDPEDLYMGVAASNTMKSHGAILYSVGVGSDVNTSYLKTIASSDDRAYPGDYAGLKSRFRSAVGNINSTCTPVTTSSSSTSSSSSSSTSSTSSSSSTSSTSTTVPTILVEPEVELTASPTTATVEEGTTKVFNLEFFNRTTNAGLNSVSIVVYPGEGRNCSSPGVPGTTVYTTSHMNAMSTTGVKNFSLRVETGSPDPMKFTACGKGYIDMEPGMVIIDGAPPEQTDAKNLIVNVKRIALPE